MRSVKLLNQSHPQTLMIATVLLYMTAVLQFVNFILYRNISPFTLLFGVVLPGLGAWATAGNKRWGYYMALVAAGIPVLLLIYYVAVIGLGFIMSSVLQVIFTIALFALLIHPQSRTYVKEWFA